MWSSTLVDEVGYLGYDARAADLLFQLVSRRYEHRSLLITTNLPFKDWDTVFPNASCAVALIDRLTHHVEILVVEGRSYRRREAELTQQQRKRPRRTDPAHDDDPPPRRRQRGSVDECEEMITSWRSPTAAPGVNRHQKSDRDAAEWLPPRNRCWFAARVVEVRRKYGLTIDRREADAIDAVLSGCSSTDLVVYAGSPAPVASAGSFRTSSSGALSRWDDNPGRSDHVRGGAPSRHRPGSGGTIRRTRTCGMAMAMVLSASSGRPGVRGPP